MQVLDSSDHERQTMKAALEMAVLSNVRHPNVIHVYCCMADMVEHGGKHWGEAKPMYVSPRLTCLLLHGRHGGAWR